MERKKDRRFRIKDNKQGSEKVRKKREREGGKRQGKKCLNKKCHSFILVH